MLQSVHTLPRRHKRIASAIAMDQSELRQKTAAAAPSWARIKPRLPDQLPPVARLVSDASGWLGARVPSRCRRMAALAPRNARADSWRARIRLETSENA